jgi:hypothetical protein
MAAAWVAHEASCRDPDASRQPPDPEGLGAGAPILPRAHPVPPRAEVAVDEGVVEQEPPRLRRGAMDGMLVAETTARIRRPHPVEGRSIGAICRDPGPSRKAVREVLRPGATELRRGRTRRPPPRPGPWRAELDRLSEENAARPSRERPAPVRLFEALRGLGCAGGCDTVRRYARAWEASRAAASAAAFAPLGSAPGEACRFDRGHEAVLVGGVTVTAKVAHARLCRGRMMFVRACPRETQGRRTRRRRSTRTAAPSRSPAAPARAGSTTT